MAFDPDSAKFPVDLFGEERELALTLTLRSLASQSWVDPYFKLSWCTDLLIKSAEPSVSEVEAYWKMTLSTNVLSFYVAL